MGGPDRRAFAGLLGGVMYFVSGAVVLATIHWLPADVNRGALSGAGAAALVTGALLPWLPWRRWPVWAPAVLVVVAQANIALAGRMAPGAVEHYLSLYVLSYLYLGITLPPRVAFAAVPVSLVSFAVSGAVGGVDAAVTIAIGVTASEVLSRLLSRQDAVAADLSSLLEAAKAMSGSASLDGAARIIGELTAGLATADHVAVLVVDRHQRSRLTARMCSDALAALGPIDIDIDAEPSGVGVALRSRELVAVPHVQGSPMVSKRYAAATGMGSAAYVPLFDGDTSVGAIFAGWDRAGERVEGFRAQVLELLSAQAGPVLARHLEREELSVAVDQDPLTGIANRRMLDDAVAQVLPGDGLVMLDIDHFKRVNDNLGHAAGDAVLRDIGNCLRDAARETDIVGRLGGEEFLIVLPLAGRGGTDAFLARLRREWGRLNPFITFSTGSSVVSVGESPTTALRRADEALYAAKTGGRNRDTAATV
jgi:diguanylate cyclase (GGDEF)-like protein